MSKVKQFLQHKKNICALSYIFRTIDDMIGTNIHNRLLHNYPIISYKSNFDLNREDCSIIGFMLFKLSLEYNFDIVTIINKLNLFSYQATNVMFIQSELYNNEYLIKQSYLNNKGNHLSI